MDETRHDPTPHGEQPVGLQRVWRRAFLAALREAGTVRAACEACDIDRSTAYDLRRADPSFAADWEDALEDFADALEMEAVRRARGIPECVIYQGKPCGVWLDPSNNMVAEGTPGARLVPLTEMRYSDNLLMFMLKGTRPDKFAPKGESAPSSGGGAEVTTYKVEIPDNDRGDAPELAPG
jgi:hypothetical protein